MGRINSDDQELFSPEVKIDNLQVMKYASKSSKIHIFHDHVPYGALKKTKQQQFLVTNALQVNCRKIRKPAKPKRGKGGTNP